MQPSIVQIWAGQAPAGSWTPLICPAVGSCLRIWFTFDHDLLICSDPTNGESEATLPIANGNEFVIPFVGPVTAAGDRPICYVQGNSQAVNVTLFCIMQ